MLSGRVSSSEKKLFMDVVRSLRILYDWCKRHSCEQCAFLSDGRRCGLAMQMGGARYVPSGWSNGNFDSFCNRVEAVIGQGNSLYTEVNDDEV